VLVFAEGPQRPEEVWEQEGDALITAVPGYALGVFTADCLPVLLFDPVQRVAGIVHAGWRGTAKALSQKVVWKMKENFHCQGENIRAALGPCIGACCFEVDALVQEAFIERGLPWELMSSPREKGKWSFDLHQANTYLLKAAGLKEENIQALKICTSCRRDIFYSYRAERHGRGQQLNFIALRKEERGGKKFKPPLSPEGG